MPASSVNRLICLIGQLGNGGTERQLYLFLKHLDRAVVRPLVAVSGEAQGVWRERIEDELGVPVEFVGGVPGPLKLWRFRRLLGRCRPDAILSWSFFTNPFRLVSGKTWFVGSLRQQFAIERDLYPCRVKACLGCPKLIVNSRLIAAELRHEGVPADRIEVVYNVFEPAETIGDRAALRREWKIPDDAMVVAGAGRDAPEKDFPFFLATFAAARQSCPRLHGLLLGAGGKALLPAIRDSGLADAFTVTGEIPDGRRLFAAADIFFLSSRAEGLPNVMLEAIDAGCAILATDVGGVRDVLGEESRATSCGLRETPAGIIIAPGDITAGAQGLLRLAEDETLRVAMADAARRPLARFSPAAAMKRYLEILRFTSAPATE